jgi:hypothetical protein
MFGIVVLVGLLYASSMMVWTNSYVSNEVKETGQIQLADAVENSSYAAAQAMLKSPDLSMDYTNPNYEKVDPDTALDTFLTLMCFNYDLNPTDENKHLISENYVPMVAVAGVDGYYIASQRLIKNSVDYPESGVNDGDWDLEFGMKMPYSYAYGGNDYDLNMTMNNILEMSGSSLIKTNQLPPTSSGIMSQSDVWRVINSELSTDMADTLDQANATDPGWKNTFYIPEQVTTFSGVEPINGPTFIALVQNVKLNSPVPVSSFSVSGVRMQNVRTIVGYERNGIKYYSYADLAPAGVTVEQTFTTKRDAALAGYYYDTKYMG